MTSAVVSLLQSVSYDQSDYPTILNFHHNGHDAPFKSITSVRGDMRPAVSGELRPNPEVQLVHFEYISLEIPWHAHISWAPIADHEVVCLPACMRDFVRVSERPGHSRNGL